MNSIFSVNTYYCFNYGKKLKKYYFSDCSSLIINTKEFNTFMEYREKLFNNINDENIIDSYLDAYQNLVIFLMGYISNCKDLNEKMELKIFMSQFSLIDCINNIDNSLFINETSPYALIEKRKKQILIEDTFKNNSFLTSKQKKHITDNILNKYRKEKIFSDDKEYTILQNDIKPIYMLSTLNKIDSITLIDKIQNIATSKKEIKVAYFGIFSDEEQTKLNIEEYFENIITLEMNRFEHIPTLNFSSLFYENKNGEYYDILNINDLKKLFANYDIVLFLDEGYYYNEINTKTLDFDDFYRMYKYTIKQINRKNDFINYRKLNFIEKWLKWSYAYFSKHSGLYEFNKDLYENILNLSKICNCNIYLYISEEKQITNLKSTNDVLDLTEMYNCYTEFHNGKELLIVHFDNVIKKSITSYFSYKNFDFKLRINAYDFIKKLNLDTNDFVEDMDKLKNICLEWDYKNIITNKDKQIFITLYGTDNKDLSEYIMSLFYSAFEEYPNVFGIYIRDIIIDTIKMYAYNIEDFIFFNSLRYFNSNKCICNTTEENMIIDTLPKYVVQCVHNIVYQLDTWHFISTTFIKRDLINKTNSNNILTIKQLNDLLNKLNNVINSNISISSLLKHNINLLVDDF